jgi:hypothetical protein
MHRNALQSTTLLTLALALAGCDLLGMEPASALAARKEAEGKAVGGACRHAGRAIEDCYTLNKRADKAAVFNGWREMNDYMRENKIENVSPQIPTPALLAAKQAGKLEDGEDEAAAHEPQQPAKAGKGSAAKH